jgi:pyruvate kinase
MQNKTKIIATIGLSSNTEEIIKDMISSGMDFARLNFSWGTYGEHLNYINIIRKLNQELNKDVKIIQDLSGPRIQNEDGHEYNQNSIKVLTEKDLKDLVFGLENNVDYVAMSYVGDEKDILNLREEMQKIGKVIPIIAKIERKLAYENLDKIIEVADALMIARGDLGNEVPLEQIPFMEKDIIERCNLKNKFVIVATQMMFSMKDNIAPTRAEVTDVAFAVISGANAVMLSDETASGKYPVESISMMSKIINESLNYLNKIKTF